MACATARWWARTSSSVLDFIMEEIEKEVERVAKGWPNSAVDDYRAQMKALNENVNDVNKLYRPAIHYVDHETEKLRLMQKRWAKSHNAKKTLQ